MISASISFALLGAAIATPSVAAETANDMLAAMTRPMLALDPVVLDDGDALAIPDAAAPPAAPPAADAAGQTPPRPKATLAALVQDQEDTDTANDEEACLAVSVYFEAKGEPLAGQLAVAETVMNRAASGRFPTSICGVVQQKGQFSFVRGGRMPATPRDTKAWRQAVAVARIARGEMWDDVAPAALYFHASRVAPRWGGAKRVTQLGNHVFYR